jgi:hypothetical protein
MSIHTLPPEIISIILSHIPDKTLANITCKLFQKLLQTLYDTQQLSDINDSYFLNKHFPNLNDKDFDKITNINNYKCLNLIAYKLFVIDNVSISYTQTLMLIKQNCKLNNVTRPKYMQKMYQKSSLWLEDYTNILEITLLHKSYDMLILLFSLSNFKKEYIDTIPTRFEKEKDINVITYEIDYLVKNNVLDYTTIYVKCHPYTQIPLYNELYKHLEKYVNKNIVQLYT